MNLNDVYISGYLGANPSLVKTDKSEFMALNLAVPNSYFDQKTKEWVEQEPSWVDVLAFKPTLRNRVLESKKGDRVLVRGSLKSQKKEIDGKNITFQKIIATSFSKLEKSTAPEMDFDDEAWPK